MARAGLDRAEKARSSRRNRLVARRAQIGSVQASMQKAPVIANEGFAYWMPRCFEI